MSSMKKQALGRGLNALIADAKEIQVNSGLLQFKEVNINSIETNPYQPRTHFDEVALEELSQSIKKFGIIQPITLSKVGEDKYQIISGERRFRASKLAGLTVVPAYLRQAGDEELLEMALIENIQRENLNPVEVALSYQRLIDEFSMTQEQVSVTVGKNRTTVTNMIRLLKLPVSIQLLLQHGSLQMGHARALLSLEDDKDKEMLAEQIVKYDFSVRKVEELVKEFNGVENQKKPENKKNSRTPNEFKELKSVLSSTFNTKVGLSCNPKGNGKITINFDSEKELERIIELLDRIKS